MIHWAIPQFDPEAEKLGIAISIAVRAHQGQVDKDGLPYILHSLRVMHSLTGFVAQQVGVLHDVVEDTTVTVEELSAAGLSQTVTQAVALVTHDKQENYEEYIIRLKPNDIARAVKLADLFDNSRIDRVIFRADHQHRDRQRVSKYFWTQQFLNDRISEPQNRQLMTKVDL